MPSIFLKYFLKRWGLPLLGGVFFFGGLLMANDLVRISRDIFAQGASVRWLLPILLTTLPETLSLVLPMAAILGGLIGTQQLSDGSEMVASQGLGVGKRSILKPWGVLSVALVILASINAHLVVPRVSSRMDAIQDEMTEETKTRFLKPGSAPFFPSKDSQNGIWVAPTGEIHVFEVNETTVQHLVAKDLEWQRDNSKPDKPVLRLNLKTLKGSQYQKSDGNVGLLNQQSQTLKVDLPNKQGILPSTPVRYYSTSRLLDVRSRDAWLEFARRISIPFATAALLLLGIGLGLSHPRFKRGGALLESLGVILAYYMAMRFAENSFKHAGKNPAVLFLPPLVFTVAGLGLLAWKLKPHHTRRFSIGRLLHFAEDRVGTIKDKYINAFDDVAQMDSLMSYGAGKGRHVLAKWARRLWWKNWGAAMGTLLTLDLMMEFAAMAGDLYKSDLSILVFLKYWLWNLPSFLTLAFPVSFLLGGVLAFSEAALSREWVALRAGGGSLLQWIGSGARAWIAVLVLAFGMQVLVAPMMVRPADNLSRTIRNRGLRVYPTKPWMNLSSTGVLWFLDRGTRWGFPLKSPGEAPILYRWNTGDPYADALPWDSLTFSQGPAATDLFPSKALRRSERAEETSTLDLVNWQQWAPDPERGTLFWSRMLGWLAGPCLVFAMLAFTFPAPRGSRGRVLGAALVVGLLFLGMQAIFGGAARAGEIPALWGVLAPLLLLVGYGCLNVHRLRT